MQEPFVLPGEKEENYAYIQRAGGAIMLKTLLSRVREYKKYAFITPLLMIGEVAMEVLIPTLMAAIVDVGVTNQDMDYVFRMGVLIIIAAFLSLSSVAVSRPSAKPFSYLALAASNSL